jgi:exopolysaccharide biosynthesis protein
MAMPVVRRALTIAFVAWLAACSARPGGSWLGRAETIAPGVEFFRVADEALVEHTGPVAICLLRLDPARVRLSSALSKDELLQAESVADIAARHGAIAAVNGGFFNATNGEPLGLLKVDGELVSDSASLKGAVAIGAGEDGALTLDFDQVSARMTMTFSAEGQQWSVPIDGVDTTRERGRLMLYTPAYHGDTDTAPTGTEWVLDGQPLRVVAMRPGAGHSRIPRHGAVLSYGGTTLPPSLTALTDDVVVAFETTWKRAGGAPAPAFARATDVVSGAGLLRREQVVQRDWRAESLTSETFTTSRHPRTLIGRDVHGRVWLVAVDGRVPDYSIGMTFADLQRLCDRLELTDALNLDGGGSTTMVVKGQVVNHPSNATGARPVSDALIVTARGQVQ